jgi:hypothetical protein
MWGDRLGRPLRIQASREACPTFRPVLGRIVIWIQRAQRPRWQGRRAARYSINSGQAADAANEAAPPLGKVTRISRTGLGSAR